MNFVHCVYGNFNHISEGVSMIGWYSQHVDVHLLVSNALHQNFCIAE